MDMTSNKKIRAIVIFPQFENACVIEGFRQRLDPQASLIAAHTSVVFPFESEYSTEQLRDHLQRAVLPIRPFTVNLSGITGHEGEYLFLNVQRGKDTLIELYDRLHSDILSMHRSSDYAYLPRITVGRLIDGVTLANALEIAQGTNELFKTAVTQNDVVRIGNGNKIVSESATKL